MSASSSTVPVGTIDPASWDPFPLEVVEAGDPAAEVSFIRTESHSGAILYVGLFRTQPSRWGYVFPGDESFHLLEGRITITVEGGETIEMGPGSIASFSKGTVSTWEVHEPMKKFFAISA